MGISKNPKKLSKTPKVVCFTANIEEFLSHPHASKPIYGCIFSDQVAMNASLLKASLFVHTKTGIPTDEKLFNSNLMTAVGGHNFNGKELLDYKSQVAIPMKALAQYELLKRIENEFDSKVITPIIEKNKDNFILFSIINTRKFKP